MLLYACFRWSSSFSATWLRHNWPPDVSACGHGMPRTGTQSCGVPEVSHLQLCTGIPGSSRSEDTYGHCASVMVVKCKSIPENEARRGRPPSISKMEAAAQVFNNAPHALVHDLSQRHRGALHAESPGAEHKEACADGMQCCLGWQRAQAAAW